MRSLILIFTILFSGAAFGQASFVDGKSFIRQKLGGARELVKAAGIGDIVKSPESASSVVITSSGYTSASTITVTEGTWFVTASFVVNQLGGSNNSGNFALEVDGSIAPETLRWFNGAGYDTSASVHIGMHTVVTVEAGQTSDIDLVGRWRNVTGVRVLTSGSLTGGLTGDENNTQLLAVRIK